MGEHDSKACQMSLRLKWQQVHVHLNVQKCFMNKNCYKKNVSNNVQFFLPLYSIKYKYIFVLKYVYIQSKKDMQITL